MTEGIGSPVKDPATSATSIAASSSTPTVACLSCRSRKIRCERSSTAPDKCKRCQSTDTPCLFKEHHRGKTEDGSIDLRKIPKRKLADFERQQQQQQQQQQQKQQRPHYGDRWSDSYRSTGSVNHSNHRPRSHLNTTQKQRFLQASSSNGSISDAYHNAPSILSHSSPLTPRPKPSQDLQEGFMNTEALEDHDAAFQRSFRVGPAGYSNNSRDNNIPGESDNYDDANQSDLGFSLNIAPNIRSDAFANGVIRWERLETIFNWHMRRVDPHAGLLDPDLHTASYTREHYPLLFSALTTMSAKARQDPEYPAMVKFHEGLDTFATLYGNNCLDRVLAKIAILIWGIGEGKWTRQSRNRLHRIHQIVTDAIDLSLHLDTNEHDFNDNDADYEVQWREQASQRRTWVQLCLIYQTHQFDVTKQSDCILGQKIPTSDAFLVQCSRTSATVADYRLAASLEIMATRSDIIQVARLLQAQTSSPTVTLVQSTGIDLATLHHRLSDIFDRWFITDGEDVYPRGRLDNLAAQDVHFLASSTRFYLNQVTWLWSSFASDSNSSRMSAKEEDSHTAGSILHPSPHSDQSHDPPWNRLNSDEIYWFTKTQTIALEVLASLDKMRNEEVTLSQDFVYVSASKISLWLSRYHTWFSPAFLQDIRLIMSNLSKRCMAATSRRGNTIRCFARLMEAIVRCLPPLIDDAPTTNQEATGIQSGPELQPAPVPTMSTEADAGILRPWKVSNMTSESIHLHQPPQQHQPDSSSQSSNYPPIDLGHLLGLDDLRYWEEMLGLDLRLGCTHDT